jgi:hypothetical protein
MAAPEIGAIDQQAANAGGAHFSQGDLLAGEFGHGGIAFWCRRLGAIEARGAAAGKPGTRAFRSESAAIAPSSDSVRQRATHGNIGVAKDRYLTKPTRLARFDQGAPILSPLASVISNTRC